jgi:hypothetical protein
MVRSSSPSNSFPGYPHLKRVIHHPHYGRMELLEVQRTSDGYLLGTAVIGEGDEAYIHRVFLGLAPRKAPAPPTMGFTCGGGPCRTFHIYENEATPAAAEKKQLR